MTIPKVYIARKRLHRRLILALVLLFALLPLFVQAEITIYPAPPGAPANSTFTVEVRPPGGTWTGLFAYDALVDKTTQSHMSFVYFDSDFSTDVEVRVTKNSGTFGSVKIRPESAGITPTVSGNTITFTMTAPKKLSVELDDDIYRNLFVFANGKEMNPITSSGPNTRYYGPGTHLIGNGADTLYPADGETVYIAGGAIVYGNIEVRNARDVTVAGRGILSGSMFDHEVADNAPKPSMVEVNVSTGITIRDIILLDSVGWNVPILGSQGVTVDNLKIIGWTVNSDGIIPQLSRNVTINDSFIRNNDDCISIKLAPFPGGPESTGSHDIAIQNSILWTDQGRAILIGPESYSTTDRTFDGITVRNVDVLRVNNYDFEWAKGALSINCGDGAIAQNIAFQNIRVDGISDTTSLLSLAMAPTPINMSPGNLVQNVSFDNVSLKGPNRRVSAILGFDADRIIQGISFRNLKIDGICVDSAPAGDILTNDYIRNITFACGPAADIEAPSVPLNLRGHVVSPSTVILTWIASADNVAVAGYKIYRNGSLAGTSTGTSYSTIPPTTDSNYTVSAYDAANNESAQSTAVLVLTPPVGFDRVSLSRTPVIKEPRARRYRLADELSLSY